jgi:hypothetical protein
MAGLGKKTFTAGDVLIAGDVNGYLMDQTVMNFASAAARSSAIPVPSTGMTSYRSDINQIESYDGSSWRGPTGLQLVKKQTIETTVSSVVVSDAFNASYENYKIIVTGGSGSTPNNMILTMTGATSAYYMSLIFATYAGGVPTNANVNNGANWSFTGDASANGITMNVDLLDPFNTKTTRLSGEYITLNNAGHFAGYLNNTTSYSSFTIAPTSGTLTGGTIYVYGYGR